MVAGDLQAPQIDTVLGVEVDVADEEAVDRAFARIESELAPVDLLVLNAGIFVIEPFEETSTDSWQRTLDVNLTGAFVCARRALPGMRERGFGRIVAIGSSAGKTGGAKSVAAYAASKAGIMAMTKSIAAYGASKAGIMAMAKSIASEYAGTGVTANALAPALIDTEMVAAMPDMREKIPLGRFGTPQEVADVVAFLCSDHSSFITGEVVDVNGGFLID